MNLRLWLKQNFFRRGLRWLSETAQYRLFANLRLPSWFPRLPWRSRAKKSTPATLLKSGRRLDVVGDENVRLDLDYLKYVAPLNALTHKITIDELKAAIARLPNSDPPAHFFPTDAYLEAVRAYRDLDVEFVHRCRVRRADSDATFLLYDRPD